MVDPGRSLLQGVVEVDKASVPCRDGGGTESDGTNASEPEAGRTECLSGKGRSAKGRILLAAAVELSEGGGLRRIRLRGMTATAPCRRTRGSGT